MAYLILLILIELLIIFCKNMIASPRIYHFLACEGHTEYVIFSYLTRNRFRDRFSRANTNVEFSDKANVIVNVDESIYGGKLNGVKSLKHFNLKYVALKVAYPNQTFFFFLDEDLDDSAVIKQVILQGGDFVQFVTFNSEYLLLERSGNNPLNPTAFATMQDFRNYCKEAFLTTFGKEASRINDKDLDVMLANSTDADLEVIFNDLFSLI